MSRGYAWDEANREEAEAAMTTIYATATIRSYDDELDVGVDGDGRYISEVDEDSTTRKRHLTYDAALFRIIKVLASYGTG
jgi:hypothetical protein